MENEKKNEKKPFYRKRHKPYYKKHKQVQKAKSEESKETQEQGESRPVDTPANEVTETETLPLTDTPTEPVEEQLPTVEAAKFPVVGIRFRPVGKTYSFDPNGMTFSLGEHVIVETSQGQEFGTVSATIHSVPEAELVLPVKKVLRKATDKDLKRHEENRELELKGRKVFQEMVQKTGLEMALSDVECAFDRSKIIFYFTSDGRVDFREFVKEMASIFKARIELRQIGVRDEAKQLGGLGICGRPLCCASFLNDFQQVSIKMAKEQNLSLNPTKISGTCGRLMCCLRYENDVYVEAAKRCPRADSQVITPQGKGTVTEVNILCGKCKVRLDDNPENIVPFDADQLKPIPKQKKSPIQEKAEKDERKEDID